MQTKEIKFCSTYGLYEITRETASYIFIKKYDDIVKEYYNYSLLEYCNCEKFYIFDDKLSDKEIKASKKTFEWDRKRTTTYFLKKGDIYVKKYDEIIFKVQDDYFYSNDLIRKICCEAKAYCKHLENIIYWEEEYLNAPQSTKEYNLNIWKTRNDLILKEIKELYIITEEGKKYIKKWLKLNVRKYLGREDGEIPYGRVIKMFYKNLKNLK